MIQPSKPEAYDLIHQGALVFSEIEHNGMRIDVGYLDKTIVQVEARVKRLEDNLRSCDEYSLQRKRYGKQTNLTSRDQLAQVLFGDMDYECKSFTSGGAKGVKRPQLDEVALERIGSKYAKGFLRLEKLNKLLGTYLRGVRREVEDDGFLHPFFNLHTVHSHRSSSSNPNFQNIPIRDPMIAKLIRQAFVPRDGHVLVETDYSAQEFRVCACFWNDPAMIAYASDPNLDIHRDMAAECYMLDEVPKNCRFFAKNQFVFPELYVSYYVSCAKNLWGAIDLGDLKTANGVGLKDHLVEKGIQGLGEFQSGKSLKQGTFEKHIKEVEEEFNNRFPVWSQKKIDWLKRYRGRGWFEMLTGFVCSGVFSRNQLYNIPIQGPSFHCLLWSLIRLVKEMKKKRMKSVVVGQIHDSILCDVHKSELDDYIQMVRRIMTEDIVKAWPWIVVPLSIDVEVAESCWFDKGPLRG